MNITIHQTRMKLLALSMTALMLVTPPAEAVTRSTQIAEGTPVDIRLIDEATSDGENIIHGIIHNDVYSSDNEYIAIRYGTPVSIYTTRKAPRSLGRPGEIDIYSAETTAVDGSPVMLMLDISVKGKGKQGLAWGLGIPLGIFTLIGFVCLTIEGKDAKIPSGAVLPAVTSAYYPVNIPNE